MFEAYIEHTIDDFDSWRWCSSVALVYLFFDEMICWVVNKFMLIYSKMLILLEYQQCINNIPKFEMHFQQIENTYTA